MSRRRRRQGGDRFARLPLTLLEQPAVSTLGHATFRVLVLLAAGYHGTNNGAIGVTAAQAAQHGIGSRDTFYRSLRELQERDLIVMTYPASRVPPRPTMWALAWLPVDDTKYSTRSTIATHAYRRWQPRGSA